MDDELDRSEFAAQEEEERTSLLGEGEVFSSTADRPGVERDFNEILFWARLAASQCRKSPARTQEEARILRSALSEQETFLAEFFCWRDSNGFTAREKAAMEMSESISRKAAKKSIAKVLKTARRHFNTSEMVQLTLTIRAINDWFDLHSRTCSHILIVQEDAAEQEQLRTHLRESGVDCSAIFVQRPQEALSLMVGVERQLFRSQLLALVVDVRLPAINGTEFLGEIRSIPSLERLPVIVMTSSSDERDVEECNRLRLRQHLEEAVDVSSFAEALVHIVDQKRGATPPPLVNDLPKEATGTARLDAVSRRLREHFQRKEGARYSALEPDAV